jgi:hypothetical protein
MSYYFQGDEGIATHALELESRIGSEVLKDKIFYSVHTFTTASIGKQGLSPIETKILIFVIVFAAIIGLLFFNIVSRFLFIKKGQPSFLRYLFILLGTLLSIVLAILFFHLFKT